MSILDASSRTRDVSRRAMSIFAKARNLQNKVMADTQQKVTSMVLSEGAGSMAAMVPLDKRQESQAAPHCARQRRIRLLQVDASAMANANLSDSQRAVAKTQEDDSTAHSGPELTAIWRPPRPFNVIMPLRSHTIRQRNTGILPSRILPGTWDNALSVPGIILRRSAACLWQLKNSRLRFRSAPCSAWPTSRQINMLTPRRPLHPLGVAGMQRQ